jgi:predicted nucleic acid-binding protein
MKDKIFVDTNIFLYSAVEDNVHFDKRNKAVELIQREEFEIVISTQVINEFYAILIKNRISDAEIQERIYELIENAVLVNVIFKTMQSAWKIRERYGFSYWDSLIVASALECNCSILYTEDLQDGQLIEKKLKIINPFANATT